MVTVDVGIVREMIDAIQAFPEAEIRTIVDRVPDKFLTPVRRTVVFEGLLKRRAELRVAFQGQYGGAV